MQVPVIQTQVRSSDLYFHLFDLFRDLLILCLLGGVSCAVKALVWSEVSLQALSQVIRLGGEHFYPLNQLAVP